MKKAVEAILKPSGSPADRRAAGVNFRGEAFCRKEILALQLYREAQVGR
jgi:hypothetical protein